MPSPGLTHEERDRLFDLLIHDLRSPLSIAMITATNLLHHPERYGPCNEKQQQALERAIRNIHRSQILVGEMIEILRSEERFFRRDYFYPEQAVREALLETLEAFSPATAEQLDHTTTLKQYQEVLKTEGIFVEITGRYSHSLFCHDLQKITQILRNLFSNAMKNRRRKVMVFLSGETGLDIQVSDDGPGIPAEGQKIIFGRFVRVNSGDPFQAPGLGLGLSGIKVMIEAMGGEVNLTSREGVGTTFTVKLPPLKRRKEMGVQKDSLLNGKKILAVDDEPDVLDILEEEITTASTGCQVTKATTFEKALEYLKGTSFDLVILDIMGVRGFELLEQACKYDLPAAMLTAHALSPEALKKSIEMKARAYLPKEKLGDIVPFLEDILRFEYQEGWRRLLFGRLGDFFDRRFGPDWQKPEAKFWRGFSEQIGAVG
ncbi:MAG: response regulator [Deltaproteobacteria bacterium]|nr:response regulator [Deltaproteobacteria bacterium]